MTADILNLRAARKARLRTRNLDEAEMNRQKFGASKAVPQLRQAEAYRKSKLLDGHKRETPSSD
ncbi:MAG: DUF4169 family protein [Hyphomicrobiaceae bacterium]